MAVLDKVGVRILNDVIHDLGAATALSTPFTAMVVKGQAAGLTAGVLVLSRVAWGLMGLAGLGLVAVVITGSIRLRYWKRGVELHYVETRGRVALIKHLAFVATVLIGFGLLAWVATSVG